MNTLGRPLDPMPGEHSLTPTRHRILVVVGACLAVAFGAYVLFSGAAVRGVADASGARPEVAFNALWFAEPSVASKPVPRGTPLTVAVSNQTADAQTVQWSTASAGTTLERGAVRLGRTSTKTFVVSTRDARVGEWFSVRLDGTSIVIKAMITS